MNLGEGTIRTKVRTVFLALSVLGALSIVILVMIGSGEESVSVSVTPLENRVYMEEVSLTRAMPKGGYIRVNAESAYVDVKGYQAALSNARILMEDGVAVFSAVADRGRLSLNKYLEMNGHIKGKYNELSFIAGEEGSFVYDFADKKGILSQDVAISAEGGVIKAAIMYMDYDNMSVLFEGGVKFIYGGSL